MPAEPALPVPSFADRLARLAERAHDRLQGTFPRGDAAVLLLLVGETGPGAAPELVLTRRHGDLGTDPGFVAFPGGRIDPGESPEDAARRECEEEVGIDRDRIVVHGRLDETWNGAGFRIVPVVGSIEGPVTLSPRDTEVSAAAAVPYPLVADDAHHQVLDVEFEGLHFRDDVIEFVHATTPWRLYGPTADLARDLVGWLRGEDRRRHDRRQLELDRFAALRRW